MAQRKILIVHEDESFVDQVRQGLQTAAPGTEVTGIVSSARAEATAEQLAPNAIVVQAEAKDPDGYQLTERIKANETTRSIPVMIISAAPSEAASLRARQVGASAFVPFGGPVGPVIGKIAALMFAAGSAAAQAETAVAPPVAAAAPAVADEVREPMSMPAEPDESSEAADAVAEIELELAGEPVATPDIAALIIPPVSVEEPPPAVPSVEPLVDEPLLIPESALEPAPKPAPVIPPAPAPIGGGVPQPVAPPAGLGIPQPVAAPAPLGAGVPQPVGDGVPQPVAGSIDAVVSARPGEDIPHIDDLLRMMIDMGGSDLHITVGSAPGIRLRGDIAPVENCRALTARDTQQMILSLLSEEQRRRFETELELDFAYAIPGLSRFRANVFQQRGSMGAVFRVIPIDIPTMDKLQLPRVCKYLSERPRGLVLVTGPTGSGKSTTLAAMIDHINETRAVHIITMEDPIEFMHRNKMAYVNQREIGEDTHSFASALKRVLRQDPDVILVGEMRDLETISAAITAAETGHLVLATLHTTGGPETVDRIIDVFPPHQQQQVRMQLSNTLEGVLSQVLLRANDGKSRVMAMEIMLGIPAISNLIREGKTHQMESIIQGGAQLGMQTLDQNLKNLLQGGRITFDEAISKAKNPRELAVMVGRKI